MEVVEPDRSQRPLWKAVLLDIQWVNLFNPRMWFAAFWTGLLGSVALGVLGYQVGIPHKTVDAFIGPFGVVLMGLALLAHCADCRARIKVGATACRNGHSIGSGR
jgi:hypothetical protein